MKLSFLLWLTRRRFYKGQHVSHKGWTTFHFCRSFGSRIASEPAQEQQTPVIFLTQAYSSRQTQHAPGSEASKFTNTSCREESGLSGRSLIHRVQERSNACKYTHAHGTCMHTFSKKNSRFWGKLTRSGDRKQGIFLVRPYDLCVVFFFLSGHLFRCKFLIASMY